MSHHGVPLAKVSAADDHERQEEEEEDVLNSVRGEKPRRSSSTCGVLRWKEGESKPSWRRDGGSARKQSWPRMQLKEMKTYEGRKPTKEA